MKMRNYYNIEELKGVKISDILRDYGILVNKSGFFSVRNERTPSCKIYAKTNSFYDFGSGTGGNPINLIEYLEGCSRTEAMDKLASMYGIEPINRSGKQRQENVRLTDSQYALLGIAADKATKNMVFDLDMEFDELKAISDRYMIPMNDLKEKYPAVYETVISTVAVEEIGRKRNIYRYNMYNDYVFRNLMKTIENLPIPSVPSPEEIIHKFGDEEKELNRVEKVMRIACNGCKSITFRTLDHDAVKEYRAMAAEMDLNQLHQILSDNPIWFDAFDGNKSREILGLPKEYNDFAHDYENAHDYKSAARKIAATIEKDSGRNQKEIEQENYYIKQGER